MVWLFFFTNNNKHQTQNSKNNIYTWNQQQSSLFSSHHSHDHHFLFFYILFHVLSSIKFMPKPIYPSLFKSLTFSSSPFFPLFILFFPPSHHFPSSEWCPAIHVHLLALLFTLLLLHSSFIIHQSWSISWPVSSLSSSLFILFPLPQSVHHFICLLLSFTIHLFTFTFPPPTRFSPFNWTHSHHPSSLNHHFHLTDYFYVIQTKIHTLSS